MKGSGGEKSGDAKKQKREDSEERGRSAEVRCGSGERRNEDEMHLETRWVQRSECKIWTRNERAARREVVRQRREQWGRSIRFMGGSVRYFMHASSSLYFLSVLVGLKCFGGD